jgi:hypothetical protein
MTWTVGAQYMCAVTLQTSFDEPCNIKEPWARALYNKCFVTFSELLLIDLSFRGDGENFDSGISRNLL